MVSLTSGSQFIDAGGTIQTAPIRPIAGGVVLVWVLGVMGSNAIQAPTPTVSGAELSFRVVQSVIKGGSRRLTLLAAPGHAGNGPLMLQFHPLSSPSDWIWSVAQVAPGQIQQVASSYVGGFVTCYAVSFANPTHGVAVAGFGIGAKTQYTPGAGLKRLGEGTSVVAGVFTEWTRSSVQVMDVTWEKPAHSLGIAVDVG